MTRASDSYRRLYSSTLWKRTAKVVIARAGGVCEACGERPATSADHHPISALELALTGQLGRFFDVSNMRASCGRCNSRAGAQLRNGAKRQWLLAQSAAEAWAERENAYWAEVERDAGRPAPEPRIY